MVGEHLGQVGIGAGREGPEHALRHLSGVLGGEGQVLLGGGEAVDVAVQDRVGVGGHRDVEASRAEAADDGIVMLKVRRAGVGSRLHDADRPPVAEECLADGDCPVAHGGLPVTVEGRHADLAEDDVDHGVDEVVLVGDVAIERHRPDAELLPEAAHGEGLDPAIVGKGHGCLQNAGTRQPVPPHDWRLLDGHRHLLAP